MNEIWKDIVNYEGLYQVSNWGRVKSLERVNSLGRRVNERILSPGKNGRGYLQVNLWKEGMFKIYTVHRLVLSTFSPIENMGNLDINHIDECKTNNHLSNLEWVTHKENINHGTRNKRIAEKNTNGKKSIPIVQIDPSTDKVVNVWESSMAAKRECGFNNSNIIKCCKGKLKTHKGYRFMHLKDWLKEHNKGIPKKLYFID